MNHRSKFIKYVGQQDKLLWVKEGRCNIVEQLCALYCDAHAGYFIFITPEFSHFFYEFLKLRCEFVGANYSAFRSCAHGFVLVLNKLHTGLTLSHPDWAVNITISTLIDHDALNIRNLFEHSKYL